jgi:hypothetical protein
VADVGAAGAEATPEGGGDPGAAEAPPEVDVAEGAVEPELGTAVLGATATAEAEGSGALAAVAPVEVPVALGAPGGLSGRVLTLDVPAAGVSAGSAHGRTTSAPSPSAISSSAVATTQRVGRMFRTGDQGCAAGESSSWARLARHGPPVSRT